MAESLSKMWDGERHLLEVGEHFLDTGARLVISGWEEDEEEDVLSPFESPTLIPVLRETGTPRDAEYEAKFPMRSTEQAWGALSVTMTAMSIIMGSPKKQYQEVNHKTNTSRWSFQSDEFITERL